MSTAIAETIAAPTLTARRRSEAIAAELRFEIEDLYAEYSACVDEGRFAEWPDFFLDECNYKIVPRENFDRGLPLCTVWAESKGMLRDRVVAITQTMMYAPHYWRHIVSTLHIREVSAERILVEANYAVFRTATDTPSEVFQVGRYLDEIVRDPADGRLKFREKLCVFDTTLIPNSLIFPI
jgi:salicylate 5-hydroxylase small subunit